MKVKFGAIVVDGRNKIGGHVMSKNRAGAYMRTKVTPVNPQSIYQMSVRAILVTISQAWRSLDAGQILAWNAASTAWMKTDIFGDLKKPSGFNLFQRLNNTIVRLGGPIVEDPPSAVALSNLGSMTATNVHSGAVTLTFALQTLGSGEQLEVEATPSVGLGVSFVKSEFRNISYAGIISSGDAVITTAYDARFGTLAAASLKSFYRARIANENTGQTGQWWQTSCISS